MTAATRALSPATSRRRWITVGLLITAGIVNYLDRSTLAIANDTIAQEMHLSATQMGLLLSAFAWSYALCQLPMGVAADRFGSHIMLTASMTVWSAAQIASGLVGSFGQFIGTRVALGIGESPLFLAGARACVEWFSLKDRGFPLGLFNSASSLGPALAPPLLTAVMLAFGWRAMFVVMGVAGFAVALAWWAYYRDPEAAGVPAEDIAAIREGGDDAGLESDPHAWLRLFAVPSTWGLVGGLFGIVYVTWLNVAWLPAYLEREFHVDVATTGLLAAIPQFAGFVGGIAGGWLSDHLARRGLDAVESRKWLSVGGLVLCALFTAAAPVPGDVSLVVTLLSVSMFFGYGAGSCSWALGASLTPPRLVATLESVQNVGGSVGGATAPLVTGLIVDAGHGFAPAFWVAAFAALAGAGAYACVRRDAYSGLGERPAG